MNEHRAASWIPRNQTSEASSKDSRGKPELAVLPLAGLSETAAALSYGENSKYGRDDYYKGNLDSRLLVSAAIRHLYSYWSGEDKDSESGVSHLGHAAANCFMLLAQEAEGTLLDGRRKREKTLSTSATQSKLGGCT